jgi:putative ABC transport system permease protein
MQVAVNRRSGEIAVLKTLGLRGRGVSFVFLVEAMILGVFGSLIGIVLGILLSFLARNAGQEAFAILLPYRLHLEPLVLGLGMGIGVTGLFAILPTLIAGQVRPALVLRSGSLPLLRAGCIVNLVSLVVLTLGIGTLADLIIGSAQFTEVWRRFSILPPGLALTIITFIGIAILLGMTWILVWFLGKLPSFRNADLRLAIRGLTLHRGRTSFSLLALIIGMTALSGTLILSRSVNTLLYTSFSEPIGGNVIALPLLPLTQGAVHNQLNNAEGVRGYRDIRFENTTLQAINGRYDYQRVMIDDPDDIQSDFYMESLELLIGARVYGDIPRGTLVAGRYLTEEDRGEPRIVIPYNPLLERVGVTIGSTFEYRIRNRVIDFEVVGMVAPDPRSGFIPFSLGDSAVQTSIENIPQSLPFDVVIATVEQERVDDVMAAIGGIPGTFVFDIGVIDSILNRILTQLSALPLLIAGLSLFAAAVLIATTVSLATMQRRRQIGILKAIGLKRRQALSQLLIENGIIGAVGGLLSLLPTYFVLAAVPLLTEGVIQLPPPWDLIILMFVLSIVITLVATLLTAWSASGEKPLTVLRYE